MEENNDKWFDEKLSRKRLRENFDFRKINDLFICGRCNEELIKIPYDYNHNYLICNKCNYKKLYNKHTNLELDVRNQLEINENSINSENKKCNNSITLFIILILIFMLILVFSIVYK